MPDFIRERLQVKCPSDLIIFKLREIKNRFKKFFGRLAEEYQREEEQAPCLFYEGGRQLAIFDDNCSDISFEILGGTSS